AGKGAARKAEFAFQTAQSIDACTARSSNSLTESAEHILIAGCSRPAMLRVCRFPELNDGFRGVSGLEQAPSAHRGHDARYEPPHRSARDGARLCHSSPGSAAHRPADFLESTRLATSQVSHYAQHNLEGRHQSLEGQRSAPYPERRLARGAYLWRRTTGL